MFLLVRKFASKNANFGARNPHFGLYLLTALLQIVRSVMMMMMMMNE